MLKLPNRCFISHSYKDKENIEKIKSALPPNVTSVYFPKITVTPEQMVTDKLVCAILDCDGVIAIDGGLSASSFWVAFETDYAKRAKLPVFRFDPDRMTFSEDASPPMHLPVYATYAT